jgi:hypothetical protein
MTAAAQQTTAVPLGPQVQLGPWQVWSPPVNTMLTHSASIGKISEAVAKAQLAIKGAEKSGENKHLESRYSKLSDIWEACHTQLNTESVAVIQSVSYEVRDIGGKPLGVARCVTLLSHSSGEWVRGEHELVVGAVGAQAGGSGITYLRRYSLAAMTGVAPNDDIDDDGERATERHQQMRDEGKTTLPAARIAELNKQMGECKDADALAKLWLSLNPEEQKVCQKLKDALKDKFTKPQSGKQSSKPKAASSSSEPPSGSSSDAGS